MDQKAIQGALTTIIYSVINEQKIDDTLKQTFTPDMISAVNKLAKKHDVAHFIYDFIILNDILLSQELTAELQFHASKSVYRCVQTNNAFEEICEILNAAGISFIPLKGSVIRPYYPSERLRTSCDIDVLIHEADLNSATEIFKEKGYKYVGKNFHDVTLISPNDVQLELHYNILEIKRNLDSVLKDVWQYATLGENSQFNLTKEFFAFHIYAHTSYHFLRGGCGIRSLLDIWIMTHKMDAPYTCAEKLLKKAGIYQFAKEMSELADSCFSNNRLTSSQQLVLKYIYGGGAYGNMENHYAVKKAEADSLTVYALKRLFLPYNAMATSYPSLIKYPFLLPFCWIARWLRVLFKGQTKDIASELSYAGSLDDDKLKEIKEVRSILKL